MMTSVISIAPTAISSESRSPFDGVVDDFVCAGLAEAILPVIPPTADVSEHLRQNRGKIPGCLGDGSWFGFKRWTEHVTTPEDIALWRTWPGAGLCIRTEVLPALDIDVDDPELAAQIAELARERIGPGALVRTREGSPRLAILFRTDAPTYKKHIAFTLPADPKPHAVELLGVGQHLVLAGRHPSGTLYCVEAPGLAGRTLAGIPSLSGEAVDDLLSRIRSLILSAGGQASQSGHSSKARQADKRLDPHGAVTRAGRRGCLRCSTGDLAPQSSHGGSPAVSSGERTSSRRIYAYTRMGSTTLVPNGIIRQCRSSASSVTSRRMERSASEAHLNTAPCATSCTGWSGRRIRTYAGRPRLRRPPGCVDISMGRPSHPMPRARPKSPVWLRPSVWIGRLYGSSTPGAPIRSSRTTMLATHSRRWLPRSGHGLRSRTTRRASAPSVLLIRRVLINGGSPGRSPARRTMTGSWIKLSPSKQSGRGLTCH
ncbi:hypothetical protein FV242_17645 [Methylobacterium sp. WL64]|nr:hypothetical protein FV242_17645 [Methylobacterium sp. WL64]